MMNPIQPFLDQFGIFILDGGLATELEALGADLGDELWSARLLLDDPALIRRVHAAYLWAGADCITTATYQATIPGFQSRGLMEAEAVDLIRFSVQLALEERDAYWVSLAEDVRAARLQPLVAASVGPYAAYRADGSEYSGDYDLDEAGLAEFHRRRWQILAQSGADLLACETIPNFAEARALAGLLDQTPGRYAWFSFSCRDEAHLHDGTPIAECAEFLNKHDRVAAVGINCTAPRFISGLIEQVRAVSDLPVIVYPNSGEIYDVAGHHWTGESDPFEFGTMSREWRKLGAACIGGCCRTTPAHIRQIRDRFPLEPRR
jgi:homocysteine S-methyltransferase